MLKISFSMHWKLNKQKILFFFQKSISSDKVRAKSVSFERLEHVPSQSGPVSDLLVTFTLIFSQAISSAAAMITVLPLSECKRAQRIDRLAALG